MTITRAELQQVIKDIGTVALGIAHTMPYTAQSLRQMESLRMARQLLAALPGDVEVKE